MQLHRCGAPALLTQLPLSSPPPAPSQAVTAVRSEESRLSADLLKARDIASGLALDVDRSRREAEAAGRAAASKTKAAAERAAAVDALRIKLADLAAEAASEMSSSTALSSAEEAELVALSKASDALKLRVPLAARDMQVGGWVGEGRGERASVPRASSACRWVIGYEHAQWFRTSLHRTRCLTGRSSSADRRGPRVVARGAAGAEPARARVGAQGRARWHRRLRLLRVRRTRGGAERRAASRPRRAGGGGAGRGRRDGAHGRA